MKIRVLALLCACLLLSGVLPMPAAFGSVAVSFYVDPAAEAGGDGTKENPFATVLEAQEAVRSVNASQTGDICVYLRKGTHYLAAPLEFSAEDSGYNGFSVTYTNYPGEDVTLSGAQIVQGFTEGEGGVWQALVELPEGIDYITSMDVNGVPARRAQSEEPGRFLRPFYDDDSTLQGFYTLKADLSDTYANPQDIQLQVAYMWRTYIFNVASIQAVPDNEAETLVTISRFLNMQVDSDVKTQISYIQSGELNWGYTVINAREELDTPGEFYYDRAAKLLYYMPRADEDMASATVEVPVLEKLVAARGSALATVKNISFSGITFAHTTWQDMARYGFHSGQSNEFYAAEEMLGYDDFVGKFIVPAAVRLDFTENVTFENNVFRSLDTVGIGLYQSANYTKIQGNQFYDLGDSAVTVGLPNQSYESTEVAGCNLAEGKKATANALGSGTKRYYVSYHGPEAAVEPNRKTLWVSENSSNEFAWWQVDLGDAYEIDRIEITARQDGGTGTGNRRFFFVQASNDPAFKTYKTIAIQGSNGTDASYNDTETFPAGGTWSADVNSTEKYRYVRLTKYKYKEEFAFSEVRIINNSMEANPKFKLSRHNEIGNNVITRVSQKNLGAPGIQTYFTEDVLIAHNDISKLPYSGVCIGWGWNYYLDMTHSKEIKVKNNRIYDVMQQMVDGGGIYNLGPQPDSEISGNHISDMPNAISGVYLDSGSNYMTVKNNVFEDVVFSTTGGGGKSEDSIGNEYDRYNYIVDNYSSSPFGSVANLQSASSMGVLEEPIVFMEGNYPEAAGAIVDAAGLTVKWQHLLQKVPEAAFPLPSWAQYENVLHVTQQGSMHDRRFIEWHLRYFIAKCRELLTIAQNSGSYPQTALATFEAVLAEANTYFEEEYATVLAGNSQRELLIDRRETLEQRDTLRAALTALAAARVTDGSAGSDAESPIVPVEPVTLTKVNVAKYKPVINIGGLKAGSATGINNDVLTNERIITPRTTEARGAIGIDLQRRYPIEQVVLYDYQNANGTEASAARSQFEILGGDTRNIDEATVIFRLNDAESKDFVANGRYVASIPDAPAYRYVFYRNLVPGAMCALREMEVFSTVTATEISRNAKTYTTKNLGASSYIGAKAVDGLYNDGNSLYLKTVPKNNAEYETLGGYYNTLTVDLHTPRHVDMIEIYGRPNVTSGTANYHGYFGLYGSLADGTVTDFEALYDEDTICGKTDRSTFEAMTRSDGVTAAYTRIALQSTGVRQYTTADGYLYDVFPDTTLDNPASYRTMVNREQAFRYLTHRKTATDAYHMTYIGEFIAYQFNPEAYSLENITKRSATIRFSDVMARDTLKPSIVISDENGVVEEAVSAVSAEAGSEDAVVYFNTERLTVGKAYTLTIGTGAQNEYQTPMAAEKSFTFLYGVDCIVSDKLLPETVSQTEANSFSFNLFNQSASGRTVLAAIALYGEGEELLAINLVQQSVEPGKSESFAVSATNLTGKTVTACKTFIWDAATMAPLA